MCPSGTSKFSKEVADSLQISFVVIFAILLFNIGIVTKKEQLAEANFIRKPKYWYLIEKTVISPDELHLGSKINYALLANMELVNFIGIKQLNHQ